MIQSDNQSQDCRERNAVPLYQKAAAEASHTRFNFSTACLQLCSAPCLHHLSAGWLLIPVRGHLLTDSSRDAHSLNGLLTAGEMPADPKISDLSKTGKQTSSGLVETQQDTYRLLWDMLLERDQSSFEHISNCIFSKYYYVRPCH